MRRLPPTGALEAFLAASRYGSLRKASVHLNLSVSALSRRVQTLEQHVGKTLFNRSGNEYRLNDDGAALLEEIGRPFDELTLAFERRSKPQKMELVVGVPTSFATAWLIPRLEQFRQTNPDIDLRLQTSRAPTERLGESLDLIIFFAKDGQEGLPFQPLRRQGAFVVGREGLVSPLEGLRKALSTVPLLVHRHLPDILEHWRSAVGLPDDFNLSIDSYDDGRLLVAAAQSGLGLALVLEDMIGFNGDARSLVRPFGEYVDTPFSYAISAKPRSGNSRAVDRFREWVTAETEKDRGGMNSEKLLEA